MVIQLLDRVFQGLHLRLHRCILRRQVGGVLDVLVLVTAKLVVASLFGRILVWVGPRHSFLLNNKKKTLPSRFFRRLLLKVFLSAPSWTKLFSTLDETSKMML